MKVSKKERVLQALRDAGGEAYARQIAYPAGVTAKEAGNVLARLACVERVREDEMAVLWGVTDGDEA